MSNRRWLQKHATLVCFDYFDDNDNLFIDNDSSYTVVHTFRFTESATTSMLILLPHWPHSPPPQLILPSSDSLLSPASISRYTLTLWPSMMMMINLETTITMIATGNTLTLRQFKVKLGSHQELLAAIIIIG